MAKAELWLRVLNPAAVAKINEEVLKMVGHFQL